MRIRKVGVVGAGLMGGGIAALAASAGVPVVLLDVPGGADPKDRGGPAREGLARQVKAKPAAFMDPARAALVQTGNTEDDLGLLADCDYIVEAIVEQPGPKQELFRRIEAIMKPTAVVASNTSGIPMHILTEGRSAGFRQHFLGTHFFSPVRYMHLLEIIPTPDTLPEAIEATREFAERALGKGIVIARDAPGFIANRLGVKGMIATMRAMEELGLTIDEADALTGPLIGRPNSATFRTGDISGLDILAHVSAGMAETTGEDFALPEWFQQMVRNRQLGDKTGGGFYRKQGRDIHTFDYTTGQYRPQQKPDDPELPRLARLPLAERVAAISDLRGKYGEFLRRVMTETAHYALTTSPALAHDITAVDRAMEWGYGHEAGPFRVMDMMGLDALRQSFERAGMSIPALLNQADGSFYTQAPDGELALAFGGGYAPVEPPAAGAIRLGVLARQPGRVLEENEGARLLDLGDGVALLEFRSKMNTLGEPVLRMVETALERVERDGMAGMVIGNDDARAFSAGADLSGSAGALQGGNWAALEAAVRRFQDTVQSVRRAPFPVVAAPHGMTLGGGAELTLHADAVQANAELYMGLVEAGVGLLPGGGGTKELLFRFVGELQPYPEADSF